MNQNLKKKAPEVMKWEAELTILAEMGFLVHDELIPLLEKHNGSIEQTVVSLLMNM